MKFSNANALNFNYILLEFYKYLNLTEDEVMVILMINHLLSQGNELINSEILSLKMNMSNDEIDNVLSKLFTKGYIEFITKDDKLYTSIDKIKSILVKCFEKSVFTDEELKENEELDQIRKEVFSIFQKEFNRSLTPIEINKIEMWITDGVKKEIIFDSLKDAHNRRHLSINYIDKIILERIRKEDNSGNDIK